MPKYRLLMDYAGTYAGQALGPWEAGAEVDLDEDTGSWIGRDRPGCIELAEGERKSRGKKNRQLLAPGRDRAADEGESEAEL
jgi:hypothetical protein